MLARATRHGDVVFHDFLAQGISIHAQKLRGLNLIPIRFMKSMLDQWPFHRLDKGHVQTPWPNSSFMV